MATDFFSLQNSSGGPLMGPAKAGEIAPSIAAHASGSITEDQSRGIYDDMLRVANRDLAGDPNRLAARVEEIRATAEAMGHPLPPPDPRTPAQQRYDGFWSATDTAQTGPSADGLPASVQPAAVELWSKAPDDRPGLGQVAPNDPGRPEALSIVKTWLDTAASPEKARELMALAERNTTVLKAMVAYGSC